MLGIFKCLALGLCLGTSLRKGVGHEIKILDCCCFCSVAQSCMILCNPMDCNMRNFPVLHHLPEFAQTHVHWVGDAIQPSCPLLFPSPPAFIFPSIRVFSNELVPCIMWQKYWNIGINPSNENSVLVSFRFDWFELLVVQRTLKSLLQYRSSKSSVHGLPWWLRG